MCDLFSTLDARAVINNKRVLYLGDSNVRSFYKDLVYLIENNKLISNNILTNKLKPAACHDEIVQSTKLHRGRDYYEVREYKHKSMHITFHFLTKCYTREIRHMFRKFKEENEFPDIIIMNSCLWDISRWGPNGVLDYKDNLVQLMKMLKSCLPERTLFIWTCVPPISNQCKGGLLVKQVQFLQHSLRFDVMEGNMFARDTVVSHGFDVLDVHYYLRMQIHWRARDGIHWSSHAVRHVTNLILTHISVALNLKLPGNVTGDAIERFKALAVQRKKPVTKVQLPKVPSLIVKVANREPKNHHLKYATKFDSEVNMSPMRKAIKEKFKPVKGESDTNDYLLNTSILSDDESFKLDVSLDIPIEDQCQGIGRSFDSSYNVNALINSPVPDFKKHENYKLTGPIRFHHEDRQHRRRKGPYSYHERQRF